MTTLTSRALLSWMQEQDEELQDDDSQEHHYDEDTSVGPITLSLLAGLSTCLGATVVFWSRHKNLGPSHMAFSLSLAGSVMITVSVASILPECFQKEEDPLLFHGPSEQPFWERCISFGVGCGLYVLLSKFAFPEPEEILGWDESQKDVATIVRDPSFELDERSTSPLYLKKKDEADENDRYIRMEEDSPLKPLLSTAKQRKGLSSASSKSNLMTSVNSSHDEKPWKGPEAKRAWRVTMLLFVSLAVHNFPEGLAVAASSLHSQKLGWTTTVAIALHNIPEGIAIAIPCLAARPDAPWLAFVLASLSGLAEPLGAAVAVYLLQGEHPGEGWLDQPDHIKNLLAFVAGVMIMVASIELYPEARRHMVESKCPGVTGTLAGIFIMLSSDAYLDS